MRRSRLGRSGLHVSPLTLGTAGWGDQVDDDEARRITEAYLTAGGTSFSAAHAYGGGEAEQMLGRLLDDVVSRDEVVITTKAGIGRTAGGRVVDTSRGGLLGQLDTSLSRLRTDHVDLWLVHTWSDEVPLEETLSALEHAVTSGKARYVGVSNYLGWQLARAATLLQTVRVPLVADEVELSLLQREAQHDTVPAAEHLGVGLLAWSPLGKGALTGKYRHTVPADSRAARRPEAMAPYLDDTSRAVVEAVSTAAEGLAVTAAEVALAWVLAQPTVAGALIGPRSTTQLAPLLRATDLQIPAQVREALDEVSDV